MTKYVFLPDSSIYVQVLSLTKLPISYSIWVMFVWCGWLREGGRIGECYDSLFISRHFLKDSFIRQIQANMASFYSTLCITSATAFKRGASGAVGSENVDSLVSDMILYSFQGIFDKIHIFARFEHICPVFVVKQVPHQL